MRRSRLRRLAWILGVGGALVCGAGAAVSVALTAPLSFLITYVVGALMGILGGFVASREPHNSIGWLMCAFSLSVSLIHLPAGYAYLALAVNHGSWPLGSFFAWFGSWSWVVVIVFLPMVSVRFPDGRVPRYMHAVDWIVVAGAVLFAAGISLTPAGTVLDFMAVPLTKITQMQPNFRDIVAGLVSTSLLAQVQGLGLVFILTGYVASATSLATRFRGARGVQRLQLEWFAYAGTLSAAALVYGGLAWNFFGQPLYLALTPFEVAALTLPIAIGVAILRYRLYDIDLLINRTLVYASLTAILGALYAAGVTFLNRLFISVSGSRSDAAYVITAFIVAVSFGPVKDWLQHQVDRRIGRRDPAQSLEEFRASVDGVVAVIDIDRLTHRLLDSAVAAFNARWAALYLGSSTRPVYTRGDMNGSAGLEVTLRHDGHAVGRLVMGRRRGDVEYGDHDRQVLQRSADSAAEAIALAERLGHLHVPVTSR